MEVEKELYVMGKDQDEVRMLYVDGANNYRREGARLVLTSQQGSTLKRAIHFSFKVTNNEAEYEVLVVGLDLAFGVRN